MLPYIELLEQYKELFQEDTYGWADLEWLYYSIGKYDECLEIREQVYILTGDERYSEEYIWNNGENNVTMCDKFGRSVKSIDYADDDWPVDIIHEFEYGTDGRCVKMTALGNPDFQQYKYEYDMDGRINKRTVEEYSLSGELSWRLIETYEWNEQKNKQHAYSESWGTSILFMNTM